MSSHLAEVGEHREQHEPAREREHVVERQAFEFEVDRFGRRDAAMAINRRGADLLNASVQRLAAIATNDVAEQLAEEADIGDYWRRAGDRAFAKLR